MRGYLVKAESRTMLGAELFVNQETINGMQFHKKNHQFIFPVDP